MIYLLIYLAIGVGLACVLYTDTGCVITQWPFNFVTITLWPIILLFVAHQLLTRPWVFKYKGEVIYRFNQHR